VGDRTAPEVAQFYLSDLDASAVVPLHHLVGFERITLESGQSRTLKFTLTPEMMSFSNDDGKLTLEPGNFRLEVGGCSPGRRGQELGSPTPVTAIFTVK
ncbi:MAG: fibronectin type III-like domain-contianing protein, partial [Anaerolineales bacterium]